MTVLKMIDLDLAGKRVLIREDLNVPVKDGKVASDARIVASLPTIRLALEKGAAVLVCSHLGRPEEGVFSEENSLAPVAAYLSQALGREVPLMRDYLDGVEVKPGEVVLLENVRFNPGEKKNSDELAQKYAALCDVYVMDAFGTAHRAQASTHGVGNFAPLAGTGQRGKIAHTMGRSLGTVRSTKGIHHIDIAQGGIFLCQFIAVFLLAGVKAHVFQQHYFTWLDLNAIKVIAHQRYLPAQRLAQVGGHRRQTVLGAELTFLRATQVRTHQHRRTLFQRQTNGGQRGHNTRITGYLAIFYRHVQVFTNQDALARQIQIDHFQNSH